MDDLCHTALPVLDGSRLRVCDRVPTLPDATCETIVDRLLLTRRELVQSSGMYDITPTPSRNITSEILLALAPRGADDLDEVADEKKSDKAAEKAEKQEQKAADKLAHAQEHAEEAESDGSDASSASATTTTGTPARSITSTASTASTTTPSSGTTVVVVTTTAAASASATALESSSTGSAQAFTLQCQRAMVYPREMFTEAQREDIVLLFYQFWLLLVAIAAVLNDSIPHMYASLFFFSPEMARLICRSQGRAATWPYSQHGVGCVSCSPYQLHQACLHAVCR
jgi:hypothetical protein